MSRDSFESWLDATLALLEQSGVDVEEILDDPSPRSDVSSTTNHAVGALSGAAAALDLTLRELLEEHGLPR